MLAARGIVPKAAARRIVEALDRVRGQGARTFVLNDPWQVALFRGTASALRLWAGPFCNLANPLDVAKRVLPLAYVRAGLPPIITVHGDADRTVPYTEAVRLHEAVERGHAEDDDEIAAHGVGAQPQAGVQGFAEARISSAHSFCVR